VNKTIALIITLGIGLALMVYSASRTLALLQLTLPTGQKEMAFLALAAFDGGLVAWTLTFMHGAEGAWQRGIALLMIIVSLLGVVIGFGADSIIGAMHGGIIDAAQIGAEFGLQVVLATVAIIAVNIAAVTFFHVMSPANRRHMQEESFSDHIEEAAFKKSNEAIPVLAAQLARELTESRMARLTAKYQNMMVADQRALPSTKRAEVVESGQRESAPGVLDGIKARLGEVFASGTGTSGGDGRAAATSTLATEGELAGEVVSAPKPLRARKS
jgi:hypothetical protein